MGWSRELKRKEPESKSGRAYLANTGFQHLLYQKDRVFHLQSDDPACVEGTITEETSGLTDRDVPIPKLFRNFVMSGYLSRQ